MLNKLLLGLLCVCCFQWHSSASAAPLVTNGGFETSDFTGWTLGQASHGIVHDAPDVHSGTSAAHSLLLDCH
jgi:hypothetical protein